MGNNFFCERTSSGTSGHENKPNGDQLGLTETNQRLNECVSIADNNYIVGSKIKFDVLNKGV